MSPLRTAALLACLLSPAAAHTHTDAPADNGRLQDFVMPFAIGQLEKRGEFMPFGAAMLPTGQIVAIGGYDGEEEDGAPLPADIIKLIQDALAQGAADGEYKATALVYDATVPLPSSGKQSDAIAVALDHRDGYSVMTFLPYELRGKEVRMGTPFTRQGTATVFQQK